MIERLLHISNVGRFVECEPSGLDWADVTLVYAENGSGKTTLSTILHSLNEDDADYILGRRTTGADRAPRVKVLMSEDDRVNVIFDEEDEVWTDDQEDEWTGPPTPFEIFDSNFVHNNVCAGYYVDTSHKKKLYQFVLGDEGVDLASRISELDGESREKSSEIRDLKSDIAAHIIGDMSVDEFAALDKVEDLEDKLEEAQQEVQQQRQQSQINRHSVLDKIELPQLPTGDLQKLLAKTLQHISAEAEDRTKAHLDECCDERGEAWVSQGLEYAENESCPFCGASLAGNDLVEAYRQYFDDAYENLKTEIEMAQQEWEAHLPSNGWQRFENTLDTNSERAETWEDYLEPDEIFGTTNLADAIQEAWEGLSEQVQNSLLQKAGAPLETLSFDEDLSEAINRYEEVVREVSAYNEKVDVLNADVQELKAAAEGGSIERAESTLQDLKNARIRHENEDVDELCQQYEDAKKEKEEIQEAKDQAREDLEEYESDLLEQHEQGINRHLRNYGAHFRITETTRSNIGGTPHSRYSLSLNGETVSLGNADTPVSERSFRNVLSEGDKNALAFAFFLARLDQDENLSEKIVVIDDPISSLDKQRRKTTLQAIEGLCGEAKQVVVLSHRHQFLYRLWKEVKKGDCTPALLEIDKTSDETSDIGEWTSMDRLVQSPQYQNILALREYCDTREGNPRYVARLIRDTLEEDLRSRFPDVLNMAKSLGDYRTHIRNADPDSPLHVLSHEPYYSELDDLAGFCTDIMHSDFPERHSPISEEELRVFAERTLDFVRGPISS